MATTLADRYVVGVTLGRGGMATVYRAHDVRHGRDVAVKLLSSALDAPGDADRFLREIRITAQLTHPHILPLIDSGHVTVGEGAARRTRPYFVMPYVAGESLGARLARDGPLEIDEALRVFREVGSALGFAHAQGVVHRDIKPDNILLSAGHAVVADFGIARAVDVAQADQLTRTGLSLGTPAYMSPEQGAGAPELDARADVYALGCVLYEMLGGAPPFTGPSARAVLARHALDPVPPLRSLRPTVEPALQTAIERALAKTPADRYPTVDAFVAAVESAVRAPAAAALAPDDPMGTKTATGEPHAIRGARSWGRRRALVIGGAVLATAIAAVLLPDFTRGGSSDHRAEEMGVPNVLDPRRLAVLPLRNLSPDAQDRFAAEGLTEEVISALAGISGLRVIAYATVATYKGSNRPLGAIARELGVGVVLEGSIRTEDDRVRVDLRLVDAITEELRWQQQYDRARGHLFDVQRDVASQVASAMQVRLLALEDTQLTKLPSGNSEAFELYVRATVLWDDHRRALVGLVNDSVVNLLTRAVALDSGFALGHAKLGMVLASRAFDGSAGASEARQRAIEAIGRALSLDSMLAEAHLAQSMVLWSREGGWRYADAYRSARRAIALKPSLASAHNQLGALYFHYGLLAEGRHAFETSLALDPSNPDSPARLPRILWYQQRFDSALAYFERGVGFAYEHALVLAYLGRSAEGLDVLARHEGSQVRDRGDYSASRAVLLARLGRGSEAESAIQAAIRAGGATSHFHHASYSIATAYAILGRRDEALRWLGQTANNGMPAYELFLGDPALENLREDPRFAAFLERQRATYDAFRLLTLR